jgi:hypothetical protein
MSYRASDVSEAEVSREVRERHRRASVRYYFRFAVRKLEGVEFASHAAAVSAVAGKVVSRIWVDESDERRRRWARDDERRARLGRMS